MNNLSEFFKKYNHWFLFVLLEAASIILLFRFNNYQGSVWFTSANHMAAEVNRWHHDAVGYLNLKDVNQRLSAENMVLQQQIAQLREALDMQDDSLGANDRVVREGLSGFTLIPARVTSNSILKNENYVVINKGRADGVETEMGVVGGGGVVGIVFLAGEHYSLVLPIVNVKSNISCRLRGQRFFGNLQWYGGSTLFAYLNDIPRYAKIRVGGVVETSGYSEVFPPGLFVGRVTQIANAPDGLSMQLKVNLGTDFANLSDVSVIVNRNKPQIDSLRVDLESFETAQNG